MSDVPNKDVEHAAIGHEPVALLFCRVFYELSLLLVDRLIHNLCCTLEAVALSPRFVVVGKNERARHPMNRAVDLF